jgi:ATP-dependent RNA helicase RhlE
MRFDQLFLAEPILRAVAKEGYDLATPIQAQAIPHALEGRDVLGSAQTGTGKTAAFALPILHRLFDQLGLSKPAAVPRCLVLCPTRELASQIADGFRAYGANLPIRGAVVFGGVSQHAQVAKIRRGIDVLVATPGRLLDLMNQGYVNLGSIQTLVLDEADRMLDMGFIHDIRKIVAQVPTERQTMLYSATMPEAIRSLAAALLRDPVNVRIAASAPTVDLVEQRVYYVDRADKPDLLVQLKQELAMSRTIVFTRTKHGADRVVKQLHARQIRAEAIHGNKSQNARQRALDQFRQNRVQVLVATDIAARGIDVDNVTHVINYDLTHEPETYVHRIGRTARAGAAGMAISFCDREEVAYLRDIERLLGKSIEVVGPRPAYADQPAVAVRPVYGRRSNGPTHAGHGQRPRTRQGQHVTGNGSGGGRRRTPARRVTRH